MSPAKLFRFRRKLNLSQAALAENLGCTKRTIIRAEAGHPLAPAIIDAYLNLARTLADGSIERGDFKERSHAYRKRKNGRKS